MCHVAVGSGHGPKFQGECLRIVAIGARDLRGEARMIRESTFGTAALLSEFYDAGLYSDWPSNVVRKHLGFRYGLTSIDGQAVDRTSRKLLKRARLEWAKGRRTSGTAETTASNWRPKPAILGGVFSNLAA